MSNTIYTCRAQLDQLLINLKIISQIQVDQRPIFKNKSISIRNYYTLLTGFIRTIAGESRNDIISGISDIHKDIKRIVSDYTNIIEMKNPIISNYDKEIASEIITSLTRLNNEILQIYNKPEYGFNALKNTYNMDPEFISKLDNITDNFQLTYRDISIIINDISKKFI